MNTYTEPSTVPGVWSELGLGWRVGPWKVGRALRLMLMDKGSGIPCPVPSPFQALFWKTFSLDGIQGPWEQIGHPVRDPPSRHADSGKSMCDHKTQLSAYLFWEIHTAKLWAQLYPHTEGYLATSRA